MQKGSMDEILIKKFLEKQKGKEKCIEDENNLETNHSGNRNFCKEKEVFYQLP